MKSIAIACLLLVTTSAVGASPQQKADTRRTAEPAAAAVKTFDTPQQAADALVAAAGAFDVTALEQLFGPSTKSVILSTEPAQDRQRAIDFVAKAREKQQISIDPKNRNRAIFLAGNDNWPFPVPIVRRATKWSFDTAAGRQEILYRRIGANELDAIAISRGFVDAQVDYALTPRQGHNQYAQKIISTPGKQDGLAWQTPEGIWEGPIGENVARAIEKGYGRNEPYHGYHFKVLKGQVNWNFWLRVRLVRVFRQCEPRTVHDGIEIDVTILFSTSYGSCDL